MDRWYREMRGPEYVRYRGPYMNRYDTCKSLEPPPEAAERFGPWNHRISDQWFFSEEAWREAMQPVGAMTPPPGLGSGIADPSRSGAAVTLVPARPTDES